MRKLIALLIVLLLSIHASSGFAAEDTDPNQIVEKAIRAHGGQENVAKLRSVRVKVEGEGELAPGQPAIPIVIEDVWQMPDRYMTTSRLTLNGQQVTQTICIDGTEGWSRMNGQVQPLPPEALKEMKEQKWAEDMDRLLPLRAKSVKLTKLPDVNVEDRPAAGIKVEVEGHRDVRLFFDKESGLLVKREHEVLGDDGKPALQSVVFSDFADKDGVKHWTKITAYRDGKRFVSGALKELAIGLKLDPKDFARPKS